MNRTSSGGQFWKPISPERGQHCRPIHTFKQIFGQTVFAYVRQRRMERAALDLHAGLPVRDAALAVGYECPRCFADAFRRHFGVLPSQVTRGVLDIIPARPG